MKKLGFIDGELLDDAVERLLKEKRKGNHAYLDFLGVRLDSDTVTLENAYQKVCHCTREEQIAKECKGMSEEEKKEALNADRFEVNKRNAIRDVIVTKKMYLTSGGKIVSHLANDYICKMAFFAQYCIPSQREAWTSTINQIVYSAGDVDADKVDDLLTLYENAGFVIECLDNGFPLDSMREYVSNFVDPEDFNDFSKIMLRFSSRGVDFIKSFKTNTYTRKELEQQAAFERTMKKPGQQ